MPNFSDTLDQPPTSRLTDTAPNITSEKITSKKVTSEEIAEF